MKKSPPPLYDQYFIGKDDERRELFEILCESFTPEAGLYPGSFVHITPSFFIPKMTYVDSDRRIEKFFKDPAVPAYIEAEKCYPQAAGIRWLPKDFSKPLPLENESFDILFSFYAGFISQYCRRYLKPEGILVANNSHGDSSLAYADADYVLIGVIHRNGTSFRLDTDNLEAYFQKKDGTEIDTAKVRKKMIGERFMRTGYAYVFQKR